MFVGHIITSEVVTDSGKVLRMTEEWWKKTLQSTLPCNIYLPTKGPLVCEKWIMLGSTTGRCLLEIEKGTELPMSSSSVFNLCNAVDASSFEFKSVLMHEQRLIKGRKNAQIKKRHWPHLGHVTVCPLICLG